MGRGNRTGTTDTLTMRSPGAQESNTAVVDWFMPAGPEATDEELKEAAGRFRAIAEELIEERDDPDASPQERSSIYVTRRALEAAVAMAEGISLDEAKARYAELSWSELLEKVDETQDSDALLNIARAAERICRRSQHSAEVNEPFWVEHREAEEELRAALASGEPPFNKLGPGALSGDPALYSRAELRKLLGFLERECKDFSDDDLRGMALDAHLIPRYKGAIPHAKVAMLDALRYTDMSPMYFSRRAKADFNAAMRRPYGAALKQSRRAETLDDGRKSDRELLLELKETNPFVANGGEAVRGAAYHLTLRKLIEKSGVAQTRPDSDKYALPEGAATERVTALELTYNDAFQGFVEQFGGARKLNKIESGLENRRRVLAYYEPSTGDIHLNMRDVKKLRKKNPEPNEIEYAVSTLSHELWHAIEDRDDGSSYAGIGNDKHPEHCIDEGATESLARIYTHDLACRMGLWSDDRGNLREVVGHDRTSRAYPGEVETVNALVAAASGELDMDKLLAGDYTQPEALSEQGHEFLKNMHRDYGPRARMDLLGGVLFSDDDPETAAGKIKDMLKICKHKRFTWRYESKRVLDDDGVPTRYPSGTLIKRSVQMKPDNLSEALAEAFQCHGVVDTAATRSL